MSGKGGGVVWYRPSRYSGEEGLKERVKLSVRGLPVFNLSYFI